MTAPAVAASVRHVPAITWHGRRGAMRRAFRYSVDYVLLEPEAAPSGPSLFGLDAPGAMSVRTRDHGGPPGAGRGAAWVREVLGADDPGGRILLLAQPRVLGHAFNPVSFWLCHDPGGALRVAIAEVTNTYGDRHSYLCRRDDRGPIGPRDVLSARKALHVSPFQDVAGGYRFRFDVSAEAVRILIDLRAPEAADTSGLTASLSGPVRPLTNGAIARAALRRPLGTRRVLALIHWQALRLWWRGAAFRARPEPPEAETSR